MKTSIGEQTEQVGKPALSVFSFSHDRYMRAAGFLQERQDLENMHFTIARTMMKYEDMDLGSVYDRAQHVVHAARVIKNRVYERRLYRNLLFQAANKALESGARVSKAVHRSLKAITGCPGSSLGASSRINIQLSDGSQNFSFTPLLNK